MIQLDTVVLSDHMEWNDKYDSSSRVAQTMRRTLGGMPVVVTQRLSLGVPITLEATQRQGWLTKAQVEAVDALAQAEGAVYNLTIGADTFTVMFRHHEPPAFSAEPLDQIGAQAPDGYYTATIKLMTV